MIKQSLLGLAVAVIAVGQISADVTGNGAGFAFPDNTPAGASSMITIGDNETIIDVTLTLNGASHTWMGDLIATLTGPSGSVVVFDRVGRTGGTGFGDDVDLNGGDYSFNDAGLDLWTATAAGAAGSGILPNDTYAPAGFENAPSSFSGFFGQSTAGTWTLSISDNAAGDTGSIGGWTLHFTSIPEPSTFAMIGIAACGLVGLAVRRRRKR